MCTFFNYQNDKNYFGRNMDINTKFRDSFLYTPKEYRYLWERNNKYFVFGIGVLIIAYILSQYDSLGEIKKDLEKIYLRDIFNLKGLKGQTKGHIHFIIAKGEKSIFIEHDINGLNIYESPIGILTNSPDLKDQMTNLQNYSHLNRKNSGKFFGEVEFSSYGQGLGAFGLLGDSTPMSRFVRTAFLKYNSMNEKNKKSNMIQIFRILDKLSILRGEVQDEKGIQKYPFKEEFDFEKINTGDI